MRTRIQSGRISNSARELSRYLGVLRLKQNTNFSPRRNNTIIINWGKTTPIPNCTYVNSPAAIAIAADKLATFQTLANEDVSIPDFHTSKSELEEGKTYLARTTLFGHSGEGIHVGTSEDLPSAPLYSEYIPKVAEYRAIMVGSTIVDFKKKKRKASPRDAEDNVIEETRINHDEHVWNLDGGYIMARSGIAHPEGLQSLCVDTMSAIGLSYAALDIIEDADGELYLLEANTMFGLEGTTTQLFGDALKDHIYETYGHRIR